jgi:uncharacterized membrane protein YfcA
MDDLTLTLVDSLSIAWWLLALLVVLAFFAGFVDAIVGGGGLIMVPGLLAMLPQVSIPVLFGTNKLTSVAGTTLAAIRYAKNMPMVWRWLGWGFLASLIMAIAGGKAATVVSPQIFRPVILFFLGVVLWLNFRPPPPEPIPIEAQPRWAQFLTRPAGLVLICAVIGFYDGFFGRALACF